MALAGGCLPLAMGGRGLKCYVARHLQETWP